MTEPLRARYDEMCVTCSSPRVEEYPCVVHGHRRATIPLVKLKQYLRTMRAARGPNYEGAPLHVEYPDFCRHCNMHESEHVGSHCLLHVSKFTEGTP
jgi:hypothetical protein